LFIALSVILVSCAEEKFWYEMAAVAPGPVWTPLIPASMKPEQSATFGQQSPMGRAGEPAEIAPSYVFLASDDSSLYTGQCLHPNGKSSNAQVFFCGLKIAQRFAQILEVIEHYRFELSILKVCSLHFFASHMKLFQKDSAKRQCKRDPYKYQSAESEMLNQNAPD
jgi:hypothetical protein